MRVYPLVLTAFIPLTAFAATGDDLLNLSNTWEDVEEVQQEDEGIDKSNEALESTNELFPSDGSESSQGTIDEVKDERTGKYVTVFSGGVEIVFGDVLRDSWFAPYVRDIAEKGIVSGYRDASGKPLGRFGPADSVTIEQVAKVLVGASGAVCDSTVTRNLTASGSWSAPYIACTEQLGWGVYQDGTIDVHRNATRAEVIATVIQAFKVNELPATGTGFTDVTLSTQFASAIEQAYRDGVIAGYSDENGNPTGVFGPVEPVNRAEFAKIVTIAMQVYAKKEE